MPLEEISYDKNAVVGSGSFAYVYRGTWKDQKVAVKQIRVVIGKQDRLDRDKGDEVLKRLHHPNVVTLLHAERDGEFMFYAFELCAGTIHTLYVPDTDPKKYRGPSLPSDREALIQLAQGMEYIHSQRVVHRHVTPRNVLISASQPVTLKWSGFGLSKSVDENGCFTMRGVDGKASWIAPEIMNLMWGEKRDGKRLTGTTRVDVWSAGCLFFWLLTKGTHPYGDPSDHSETFDNILDDNRINWDKLTDNPAIEPFAKVIERMLVKDPLERTPMSEVIRLLQDLTIDVKEDAAGTKSN